MYAFKVNIVFIFHGLTAHLPLADSIYVYFNAYSSRKYLNKTTRQCQSFLITSMLSGR